jgi:hypothetical protein
MPQVDDPEENYRRLERLLYELYHVLRALLGPMPTAGQAASSSGNSGGSNNGPQPPQGKKKVFLFVTYKIVFKIISCQIK